MPWRTVYWVNCTWSPQSHQEIGNSAYGISHICSPWPILPIDLESLQILRPPCPAVVKGWLRVDVICDASGFGIGAVLMQNGRVIAFEGRKVTDVETRYTGGEQELLAVHHALQIWRFYLEGSNCQLNVITDHAPNTYFNTLTTLACRREGLAENWNKCLAHDP